MQKKIRNRIGFFSIAIIGLLCASALAISLQNSHIGSWHDAAMYPSAAFAAGTPDSKGNQIVTFAITQYSGGTWSTVSVINYLTYTSGATVSLTSNLPTCLQVVVNLNYTLAGDASTAMARARVYINIAGVTSGNASMTVTSATNYLSTYWVVTFWYPSAQGATTWTPATDTTYTTLAYYQAYY